MRETALHRLRSEDLQEVAWGARLVAEHAVQDATPLLLAHLASQGNLPVGARSFPLCATLLDALIQLDPPIDPAVLLPHASGVLLGGVVLFLGRHPDRYGTTSLTLFECVEGQELSWLAMGNGLASSRTIGFAAALLAGLKIRLRIRVWTELPLPHRTPGGSVPGCGFRRIPDGWPPVVLHRLFLGTSPDGEFTFPGVRPVRVERRECRDQEVWTCSSLEASGASRTTQRLEWLEILGARPAGFDEEVTVDLRWTGRQPYVRQVAERRARLLEAWHASVRALVASGLLTAGEGAGLSRSIHLDVEDHRTGHAPPVLPALPF